MSPYRIGLVNILIQILKNKKYGVSRAYPLLFFPNNFIIKRFSEDIEIVYELSKN